LKETLETLEEKLFICECADRLDWHEYYALKDAIKETENAIKALAHTA
jgi:hypothetical protein